MIKVGKLYFDPNKNPAITDSATWDLKSIISVLSVINYDEWEKILYMIRNEEILTVYETQGIRFIISSSILHNGVVFILIYASDGQYGILSFSKNDHALSQENGIIITQSDNLVIQIYKADYENLHAIFCSKNSLLGPRPYGSVQRLGIGSRNSTMAWPAIYTAMQKGGFSTNAIQNSMREVCPISDLVSEKEMENNYLYGFGEVPPAYTGGTFEGIWTQGVLYGLSAGYYPLYGADADHLQLREEEINLKRIKQILFSARYYTFFTIDISHIVDYNAMHSASVLDSLQFLKSYISNATEREDVLGYHHQKFWFNGKRYYFDDALIGKLVGKYWKSLNALSDIYQYIKTIKKDENFDFELTIDEVPPGISPHQIVTQDEELLFLIHEMKRRGIEVTHIAPNFGIEKGVDYRGPDGISGLAKRIERLFSITDKYGLILDFHSGDDLSSTTRKVIGKATNNRLHYKISPSVGDVFAKTLFDYDKGRFQIWWNDTIEFAKKCAREGSFLAQTLLNSKKYSHNISMSPEDKLFKEFKFVSPGKRDSNGQLSMREYFYDLPEDFKSQYTENLEAWLLEVAGDIFMNN